MLLDSVSYGSRQSRLTWKYSPISTISSGDPVPASDGQMPAFGLVYDRVHFIKIKQDFVDVMPSLLPGKQGAKRYLRLFLHRLVGNTSQTQKSHFV